jgi:acetyl-CoA carboxylase biotin carboxylase subunit
MKILVANRGEIAVRIFRACRELDLPSVAVYSDTDRSALHSRYADEAVHIGSSAAVNSYLNISAIIEACRISGAQAVHPGYGFLSENVAFAEAVEAAGMIFIGPRPETLSVTGDKLTARRIARKLGLPVLSGPDVPICEHTLEEHINEQVTFPVLVKAVSGGGGRGIRAAYSMCELEQMVSAASSEAHASFGDDQVYLEPLVEQARHIEVQIAGDGTGEILILGERECSIQRRRQKLIEEAPAPGLSQEMRESICAFAKKLGQELRYRSLGTVEFLLDGSGNFYFIEVNPRIQVEHPVTEQLTGIDLVRMQLRLATQGILGYTQDQITFRGAAIEARVLAEDPEQGFLPTTGKITYLKEPDGPGVRVDSTLFQGMKVTSDYDSLLAKVIVWGEDRESAIKRLRRALSEFQIGGIPTDLKFLSQIVECDEFKAGRANTTYLETFKPPQHEGKEVLEREIALAAAMATHQKKNRVRRKSPAPVNTWRMTAWREQMRGA